MLKRIIALGAIAVLVAIAGLAFVFFQEPEAAEPLEAIPLEVEEESADEVVAETGAEEVAAESVSEEAAEEESSGAGLLVYQINQSASQARFELDEDLRGNRVTVVGTTDQVAGEIAVDMSDLSTAEIGTIQISAATLVTDNNNRNRAIRNFVLDTNAYELITFEPKSIEGLAGSIAAGESADFSIIGDLTIRDVTQEVSFDVTATAVSETQINGSASTIIPLEDFGLSIPDVPSVANVEDEVELYIDFTADAS